MGFSISFSSAVRTISWFFVTSEAKSSSSLLTACLSVPLELVRLSYIHNHGEMIHEPALIRMKGEGCFQLPALTTVSSAQQL